MITKIAVRNYKSLKELTLKLRPLTVFVGPNNAGKSNLLDCFFLQKDLTDQGSGAVDGRGGFRDLVWDGETTRSMSFRFEGSLRGPGRATTFSYDLAIVGGPAQHRIERESFTIGTGSESRVLLELNPQGATILWGVDGAQLMGFSTDSRQPALRMVGGVDPTSPVASFAGKVSSWRRYRMNPTVMRNLSPARRAVQMEDSGENMGAVLHTLQTEYPERFTRLKSLIREVWSPRSRTSTRR
ncbi:MAG: hypothetical protein EXR52_03355 [Dehalococcoidia bacterium]|nr:hypothetical protein [Dehalococcoidia bacterium]